MKGSWTQSQPLDLLKFTCIYLKVVGQIMGFLFLKKNHELTNHRFVKSFMVFVGGRRGGGVGRGLTTSGGMGIKPSFSLWGRSDSVILPQGSWSAKSFSLMHIITR